MYLLRELNWRRYKDSVMDTSVKRRIAYIAGSLAKTHSNLGSIYDYQDSQHYSMSGQISLSNISVFDYSTSSHFSGNGSGGRFSLFDYSTNSHIDFNYKMGSFDGFDYHTNTHFNGSANANGGVDLFDYSTSKYYSYSV